MTSADPQAFQLAPDERGSYFFIKVEGYFAAKNVLALKKALQGALDIGHTRVAVDLGGVNFVDSMAIGLLFNFQKILQGKDGQFAILNPSETVQEIFDLGSINKGMQVYYNAEDPESCFG